MNELLRKFVATWNHGARPPIYTFNVWTDPSARVSAVSVDTRDHAARYLEGVRASNRLQHERFTRQGDLAMASLFVDPVGDRCDNPADFAFPCFVEIANRSIPKCWGPDEFIWNILGPLLMRVRDQVVGILPTLHADPECEVSINGRDSWYTAVVRGPVPTTKNSREKD